MSTYPPRETMAPPAEDPRNGPSYAVEAPDVERNRLGVNLAWEGLLLVFIALATAAWFLLGGVAFESWDAAAHQLAGVAPYLLLATALAMTMRLGAAHLGVGLYAVMAAGIYANCVALGMTMPAALGASVGSIVGLGVLTALLVTAFRVPGWAAGLVTGVMGYAILSVPYGNIFMGAVPHDNLELAPLEPGAAWAIIAAVVALSVGGGALGLVPGLRQVLMNCRDAAARQGKRGVWGVLMTWLGLLGASVLAAGAGIVSLVPNPGSWAITLAAGDRILPIAIALAIALLGGTGLRGGRGGVAGTLLAAIVYYMVGFVMVRADLDMASYFLLPVGALLIGILVHWVMDLANRPRRLPGLMYADGVPLLANPPQPVPEPQHTSLEALLDARPPEAHSAQQAPPLVDPVVAAQTPPTLEDPAAQQQATPDPATAPSDTDAATVIPQQPDPHAGQQRHDPPDEADAAEAIAARQPEGPAETAVPRSHAPVLDAATAVFAGQEPTDDATVAVPAQQRAEAGASAKDADITETAAPPSHAPDPNDATAVIARQADPQHDDTVAPAARQRDDDTAVIPEQADVTAAIPRSESDTTQPAANEDGTANIPTQQRGTDDDDTTSIAVQSSEDDDSADTTALPRQRRQPANPDSADTTALPSQAPSAIQVESAVVSESAPPQEEDDPDTVKVRPDKTEPQEAKDSSDDTTAGVTPSEPAPTSSNSESFLYRPPT